MSEIFISKYNSIYFKITSTDTSVLNAISNHFAIFKPGAQFSPRFRNKIWDGKVRFFDRAKGALPIGLWNILLNYCEANNIKYTFNFDVKKTFNNPDVITRKKAKLFMDMLDEQQEFKSHPFQVESLYKGINHKRGIIRISMGGGKSYIQYATVRYLLASGEAKKVLLIVPNKGLVNQMYGDMKSYNWKDIDNNVDVLSSEIPAKERKRINDNFDKKLLITTWQSITKKSADWLNQFNAVLTDESHGNAATSLKNILSKMSCTYKLGYTGTLHNASEDKVGLYTVFAYLGPVLVDISAKELEDMNLTSKLFIKSLIIKYPEEIKKYGRSREFANEMEYIETLEHRTNVIKPQVESLWKTKELTDANVIVLVKKIDHLKETVSKLKSLFPDSEVSLIYGGVSAKERDKIRAKVEKSKRAILVATYATVSTGFNIKNLQIGFFLSSYKSKFKVLQSIGRGLRKVKNGVNKFFLFDIVDDFREINKNGVLNDRTANHAYKHYIKRQLHYKKEKYDWQEQNIKYSELAKINN